MNMVMKKIALIAASIIAGSLSGVASASKLVIDNFSTDMNVTDSFGFVSQTAAQWGTSANLGRSFLNGAANPTGSSINGGGLSFNPVSQLVYQSPQSDPDDAALSTAGLKFFYFDFVTAGSFRFNAYNAQNPPVSLNNFQTITGQAGERVLVSLSSSGTLNPSQVVKRLEFRLEPGHSGFRLSEFGLTSASTVIYSNAIHQSIFQTGYIPGISGNSMEGTGNPATVIVPFRTAGSVGDQGWILETMRIWTTNLAPLGANQQLLFQIFADDPANRPTTFATGSGSTATNWFAANTNNLTQIFSWQITFADAVDTRDLSLPVGDPYRRRNYTYNLATPLELDPGTLYWFAITAARAQVLSNFGW
jgi:hypothetical protein